MKQNDYNRLNMLWATRRHLDDHTSIWNGNEPFSQASAMLTGAMGRASAALDVQNSTTKGISNDMYQLKVKAIDKTLAIAQSAMSYAILAGDKALEGAVRQGRSRLLKLGIHKLASRLRNIVAAAEAVGEPLLRHGVTPGICEEASRLILVMEGSQALVRTSITRRRAATLDVPAIMEAALTALAIMDNLVHLFEKDYPDFVAGYWTARNIVHRGRRRKNDPPADAA